MSNNKLSKNIGLVTALSLVVGMVIGSGVFFKPKAVFEATGAPGLGMIAWILAGIITMAGGLTAAELGAAIPKTGGMITYLKESYGDTIEFLLGWAQSVIYFPGTIAALAIVFGTQTAQLLGLSDNLIKPIGITMIIFLALVNILGGSKVGGAVQTFATAGKLVPLVLIIIVGLLKGDGGSANLFPVVAPDHPVVTGLGSALIACMFAYNGWINVGAMAGEMKNPTKDLPRAIIGGIMIVMAIYVSINIAYLFALPAGKLAVSSTPAADAATAIFGVHGGKIVSIGILVSIFGTLNGYLFAPPRVLYELGSENKLPASKWFAKLSDKSGSPVNSTMFLMVLGIIYLFSGKFDQLTNLAVFVMWMFYVMTFIGVFILRKKKPELERPYKVPLYPFVPLVAIIGGIYILVNNLITQPLNAGLGILITLLGLPIFIAKKSKNRKLQDSKKAA